MSAGSKIAPVRIGEDLWGRMADAIGRRNERSADAPWTTSDFIRVAIEEKLSKMRRCARRKKRART